MIVDHDAFNRSLPRNPERTLRGLASLAGLELQRQHLQRQPNRAPLPVSIPSVTETVSNTCTFLVFGFRYY